MEYLRLARKTHPLCREITPVSKTLLISMHCIVDLNLRSEQFRYLFVVNQYVDYGKGLPPILDIPDHESDLWQMLA